MARIKATGGEGPTARDALGQIIPVELNSVQTDATGIFRTVTSDPDLARSGRRFFEAIIGDLTTGTECYGQINVSGTPTTITVRFSIRARFNFPNPVLAQSVTICQINLGAGETLSVRGTNWNSVDETVDIDAVGTNGVVTASVTATNVSLLDWHNICIRATLNTGVGQTENFTLRVDDTSKTSNSVNFATAGVSNTRFGLIGFTPIIQSDTLAIIFDDIIIDNTNANIDDDRFLVYLPPDAGRSTRNDWVIVGGAANTVVAVTDSNENTGIRASGTTAAVQELEMDNLDGTMPSSGFVPKALYLSCQRGNAADVTAFTYRVRDSADNSLGSISIASATSTTTAMSELVIDTSAKSQADINGFYYRFEYPGAVGGQSTAQEFWGYLEVEANPSLTDTGTVSESAGITATVQATDSASISESEEGVDVSSVVGSTTELRVNIVNE